MTLDMKTEHFGTQIGAEQFLRSLTPSISLKGCTRGCADSYDCDRTCLSPAVTQSLPPAPPSAPVMGTGLRHNEGKTPYQYVPLLKLADYLKTMGRGAERLNYGAYTALVGLGDFQARQGDDAYILSNAMDILCQDAWGDAAKVFQAATLSGEYPPYNWALGMHWSSVIGSCARHLLAAIGGVTADPKSGMPHEWHAAANLVMLLTYLDTYPQGDDRPARGLFAKDTDATDAHPSGTVPQTPAPTAH